MTADEFESRVVEWARRHPRIEALLLAGSRAFDNGGFDEWSDWDFQLITRRPSEFAGTEWLFEIDQCIAAKAEITPRRVLKVTGVFRDGWEADFVPIAAWKMKLVFAAMRHPGWARFMPAILLRGIHETRAFLKDGGYQLLVGSIQWERRLESLGTRWREVEMGPQDFVEHARFFWPSTVWILKRILRREDRSSIHWLSKLMVERLYPLLQEEARLAGRKPRPEARKAEQWLDATRLRQTAITLGPDQKQLASALLSAIDLFKDVSQVVASKRGFPPDNHAEVEKWLRAELQRILAENR